MTIRTRGLAEVRAALDQVATGLGDLHDGLTRIAAETAARAARYAPRRTGRLSKGIGGEVLRGRAVITTSRDTLSYARPMENRDHYMRRAQDEMSDLAPRILEDSAAQLIRKKGLAP